MSTPAPTGRDLRLESHDTHCRARATAHVVATEAFQDAYAAAPPEARAVAALLVRRLDHPGLWDWLRRRHRRAPDPAAMTARELRRLGQRLGVPRYNQLPKALLLSEIVHAQKRRREAAQEAPRRDAAEPALGGG
jgi:hypothetical protein